MSKKATKQLRFWYAQWRDCDCYSVIDAYGKPSEWKRAAECRIKQYMGAHRGYGYRVINHTCNFFTAAYVADDATGNPEFVVDTGRNIYSCSLSALA